MKRVMICGAPGSGKSTLARIMGARLHLPVHHMDHIHHLPHWQPRPTAEKHAMAHAIEAGDAWVFEGGMSSTYDTRIARADTLIWLDLPIILRLWRVTARLWKYYGQTRPDMADGCVETIGMHTWEFYCWIVQTRRGHRANMLRLMADNQDNVTIHHLKSRGAVASFTAGIDHRHQSA